MTSSGAPFSNAARNLRQLGSSPMTWSFALIILAIELLITLVGGRDRQPAWSWYETFGLSRGEFLTGKIWQILTYGFLHGGWWHVGLNAILILLIGSRIERMAGRKVMMNTALAGVIGGGAGHLVFAPGLLVGISGGCMALILLLTTLSPQSRMMPLPVSGRSLGLGIMMAALILALIDPNLGIPGLSTPGKWLVDHGQRSLFKLGHACHFGGGLAGWMLGKWLLRPRITLERLRRDRERREASEDRRTG